MMVYGLREFDERPFFDEYAGAFGFEIRSAAAPPTVENAHLAEGCPYVNIITAPTDRAIMERFRDAGVKYLVTRTIGYDHIDLAAAADCGIRVANTPYGPDGVAEYAIMLMLMCIRRMKSIQHRFAGQDYTLKGLLGGELSSMTVGVVGTGRIGTRLCQMLTGFGCRILAHSPHPNDRAAQYAEYVPMETLLAQADIISLHCAAAPGTAHMIGADAIDRMKPGAVIVNTARGALLDTDAVLQGLDTGRIGALGLDVVENEYDLFYYDRREDVLKNTKMYLLQSYPNVIVTHHMAFYTRQTVQTMVHDSLRGAAADRDGLENPWRVQ